MILCVSYRSLLGIDLNIMRDWIVLTSIFILLGSELWENDFSSLLDFVKDYIVDVLELSYDKNLSIPQSQCQNSSGELGDVGDGGI